MTAIEISDVSTPSQRITAQAVSLVCGQVHVARPRVALLSTWHPEPVDNGRKQRTRQMIAALAEAFEIALISMLPPEEIATGVLPRVPGVWKQWVLPLPTFVPRSCASLLAGLHPLPRSTVAIWRRETALRLRSIVRQARAEVAIGTDLRTLRYLLALDPSVHTLLDEPDVSPFTAAVVADRRGIARFQARLREAKYARLLRMASQRLDGAIAASSQEATAYRALAGAAQINIIENGIGDLPEQPWHVPDGLQLIYPGALTYGPNAEAVAYFTREILPGIAQVFPGVHLTVTGAVPAPIPAGCAHPAVTLTGWLARDALEMVQRRARVCVIPLRSGTGTRIKILEAMALGMPVVSTSKGAEGLDLVAGEEVLIADDPATFAAATVRLLREHAFAEALGARGRERVRRDFTWDVSGQHLRDLVQSCLSTPGVA